MKKWIGFFLLFVALLFLCFGGYLYFARAKFVSKTLSNALETPASVRSIEFLSDGLQIKDITIQNPQGCEFKNALQLGKIQLKMDWSALIKGVLGLSSDKIIIEQLRLEKPDMTLELFTLTGSDTNWSRIIEKITADSESHKSKKSGEKKSSSKKSLEFGIKRLVITDTTLEIKHHTLQKASYKPATIERIEVRDLGMDNGVALQDICVEVSSILLKEAAKQFSLNQLSPEKLLKDYLAPTDENINSIQNMLQDFLPKN